MSDRIDFAATVTADGRRIRGSVQIEGSRTLRNNEWLEVDPDALAAADASDVVARFDHDPGKILGRTTNNTVSLAVIDGQLVYETGELPNTTYANDALELVRGGYVTGSSFEVEGLKYAFNTDLEDGLRVRRITHIDRITDVSPTPHPAFESSMAAAFNKENDVADEAIKTEAPPAAPEAPTISFKDDGKTDTFRTAEAFARRQDIPALEQAMENLVSGGLNSPAEQETYDAFAKVYDERKAIEAEAKQRAERVALGHLLRTGKGPKRPDTEAGLLESDDYRHAFTRYLRGEGPQHMEQFAQSIAGSGAEGGYTVPNDFRTKIVETQLAFGGIQQHADIVETGDGRPLPWPTNNDTGNSAVVATEGSAPGSAGADLTFGQIMLGTFSIAASGTSNAPLKVSWELLQDSAFDIEAFIAKKLGERLGRKAASYYAVGVGTTEPFGLFAKTPDTMTATTAYAAFVEHMFQVDSAYRTAGNCRWIMSDTTLAKVYNSLDDEGRPLFQPAASATGASAVAGSILGFPVTIDPGAAALVAFGDIAQGFVIRRVREIQVVVDPYNNTAARQNAYHAWMRTDSAIQDSAAVSVSDYASVTADTASG